MIKEGLPILLSTLGIFIYMRIDHIMIKKFLGYEAVGIFSAALKFVEIWFAIPIFVSIAISPIVMREYNDKKVNNESNLLSNLFYYSSAVATVIAVLITLLSSKIVMYVFGPNFIEAAAILRISIWSIIFIFIGQISANWYVAKGLNMLNMKRILGSVVINILGNYFLIPTIGIKGAAISTLCSQAYATWLGDLFHVDTRQLFWQKTEGIFLWPVKVINITKSALKIYF
jgi:PST family polysaccharide transporter